MLKIQIVAANLNFLPNKLDFCCGNFSRNYGMQKTVPPLIIAFVQFVWAPWKMQ